MSAVPRRSGVQRSGEPRIPPQAIEAEQSVLGGLMLAPNSFDRIAGHVAEEDFYRRDHQLIFRAVRELADASKPYDAVTLGEWFESMGMAEQFAGGAYLIELASTTPSAANIKAYADIVRDKATLRRFIDVCARGAEAGYAPDGREAKDLVDWVIREAMALVRQHGRHEFTLRQATRLAWADAQDAYEHRGQIRGVPTGFQRMDARLGGFHRGDLVLLGARPSMGKTALMVNLALNAAAADFSVGMISGEQSAMQVGQRSIAVQARVPAECLRNGNIEDDYWPRITEGMRSLTDGKVRMWDQSAPTLDAICSVARRWKQEHGLQILFVDYLQRVRVPTAESRVEEVAEAARGLKSLARDLEIPIVALAQVKAEVDTRQGSRRPALGDIANSDEATREADLIGFLYRDEVYRQDSPDRGVAELNFAKNRHGPTGGFLLRFDGETMTFADP